jgi:hypothetical protein
MYSYNPMHCIMMAFILGIFPLCPYSISNGYTKKFLVRLIAGAK